MLLGRPHSPLAASEPIRLRLTRMQQLHRILMIRCPHPAASASTTRRSGSAGCLPAGARRRRRLREVGCARCACQGVPGAQPGPPAHSLTPMPFVMVRISAVDILVSPMAMAYSLPSAYTATGVLASTWAVWPLRRGSGSGRGATRACSRTRMQQQHARTVSRARASAPPPAPWPAAPHLVVDRRPWRREARAHDVGARQHELDGALVGS